MLSRIAILNLLLFVGSVGLLAAENDADAIDRGFSDKVFPFLDAYCLDCHSGKEPEGNFSLMVYTNAAAVSADHPHWERVLDQLREETMPPKKSKSQPPPDDRKAVTAWIQSIRQRDALKNAGDPGPVLARRLSNAEYDYTIRDLTGFDLKPTREFPVDPANQAGFDNSGESLTMSPGLLKKYLAAARSVSENLILDQDGLEFAPHPMMADTDRDKYFVLRIVDFYKRQPTDYADYFQAAWRYQHRAQLGQRRASLADIAAETKVSPRYLQTVWATLTDPYERVGPIFHLQQMWRELPAPTGLEPESVRAACEKMRDHVVELRAKLVPEVPNLTAPGINNGAQAFVLRKDRVMAANRRRYDPTALQIEGESLNAEPNNSDGDSEKSSKKRSRKPRQPDPDLEVPADPAERARLEAAIGRFASVFPDAFYISERARVFLDNDEDKNNGGRLLSAGFHSMTGYFRDDGPLYDMVLDDDARKELDRLWNEFYLVASVPHRMHSSMIWFERTDSRFMIDAEFDFARAEDKDCSSQEKIQKLAEVYYAKAKNRGAGDEALAAIKEHFERVAAEAARIDRMRKAAEPKHLKALARFAERAYRRPLHEFEQTELLSFYRSLRKDEGLDHEDAIRDCLVSVLMSPNFLYRVDLAEVGGPAELASTSKRSATTRSSTLPHAAVPLSDYALASRLSYFLWSSMPDAELLAQAGAGDLHRPEVMTAQARRMLQDPRARALAVEFGGNWLDFRRFEEHNAVDRERFPMFDDKLRSAMFEEPVRFLLDVIQRDRSILDLLYANDTFVNPPLAKFYGLPVPKGDESDWSHVERASDQGRGGLLPMSVFLTHNSPGLRTSPVKRGYWVVRQLLGEHIPPPPATVPALPADEAHLGDLTLRETLERHRADPSCASCHARFDSMGLVFEGFGPVGERRNKDLGGKPIDDHAVFPGGSDGAGLVGLKTYLHDHREADFVDNLSRKLLAYALGRTLQLSDEPLLADMQRKLATDGFRFGSLVESVVSSPQFLNKRGPDHLANR